MTSGIYSLFDRKALQYGTVFLAPNNDCAKRQVRSTLRVVPELEQFAEDYALHCLGILDEKGIQVFAPGTYPDIVCEVSSLRTLTPTFPES